MRFFLFFAVLITGFGVFAQPSIAWQRCYGTSSSDYFTDAILTNDGGFLASMFYNGTDGDAGETDLTLPLRLIKFDSLFNIEWEKAFGGTNGYSNSIKILNLADGYLLVAFSNATNGDFEGNHGGRDFALLKIDFEGNKIWAKCYGGPGEDYIGGAMVTDDNHYLITGSASFAGGDIPFHYGDGFFPDAVIMKIDTSGEIVWVKNYGGTIADGPIGDPILVYPGIYQIHLFSSSNDYDLESANPDIGDLKRWIININSMGDIIQQNFISTETDLTSWDGATFYTDNQTFVVGTGYADSPLFPTTAPSNGYQGALAIFNSDLQLTSLNQWGGSNTDVFNRYTKDEFENYFFIGTSESLDGDLSGNYNNGLNDDYWILKTDKYFTKKWILNFGGAYHMGDLNNGGFVGNLLYKNNHLYAFIKCMVPDVMPDFDIECGHPSITPGVNTSDAWVIAFDLPTSLTELQITQQELTIFPNPNNGSFQLQFPFSTIEKQLFVYNINGEKIYTTPVYEKEKAVIVLPNLSNGIYYVALTGKDLFYTSELIIFH